MEEREDYLTSYRVFFENFAATVNPEDQLPVNIAGYTITEAELPGEVLYWTTQYLTEKQCPSSLLTPLRRIILDEVSAASKKQPNEFGYNADEAVFIALRLMQAVTARVNAVCLRYLDNSRLDTLPPPPPPALRELSTVSAAAKNSRRVMEDRHVEIGNLEALFGIETTEPTSYYAVYDGHAGSAAATYCAAHLHQYLVESQHFATDLRAALRDAYLRTDAEFVRKSNQERACGGSTAVSVAMRGRRLHAAWAGDSLALLAKRMRLMQLVRPHKPSRQDERERIESSGGSVMFWGTWRVNGQLAVSRAIGDAQYKPYVTARPEIMTVELDGDEDFVVVACDGLWDFVSEDDVALAVYTQLAADANDLKAVTKRLIVQAKRQGSCDNISIILVFLKEPRQIVADNTLPMDLGLDNALANAPPFASDAEVCKKQVEGGAQESARAAAGNERDAAADNGVENSDSDSEDLGPETAVDVEEVEHDAQNNQIAPPTHAPTPTTPVRNGDNVEESHVDGALVDNVGESGEDSEDEWNYYKGEGDREGELEHQPSETADEPLRSDTPCQDNSAWESSSADMNSSPLNPDAPVFIPGADVVLAESPRKPVPMDDIPISAAQFNTGAIARPAELLDLDNCDHLNGHHNVSIDEKNNEHLNGNDTRTMDSLGFGFGMNIDPEKSKDTCLIQDFERIQKDTSDFCNIQVFQAHSEANPFATDADDELLERLKNKERDPMSMSFYQEKDDDTCEEIDQNESNIDLNAVQPLPDSDDEELQSNGILCGNEIDKENISPEQHINLSGAGPNNDISRDDRTDIISHNTTDFGQGDNFMQYNISRNIQNLTNIDFETCNLPQQNIVQTDTPESHKLLFEQIPEIPDGKSSELGFTNEDLQDPSESEKDLRAITPQDDISQDVEMESKHDDSPLEETHIDQASLSNTENIETIQDNLNDIISIATEMVPDLGTSSEIIAVPIEETNLIEAKTPEHSQDVHENITVQVHNSEITLDSFLGDVEATDQNITSETNHTEEGEIFEAMIPEINIELSQSAVKDFACEEILPSESPIPELGELDSELTQSSVPAESPLPTHSPLPSESPLPHVEHISPTSSPLPSQSPMAPFSAPKESQSLTQSAEPADLHSNSPLPAEVPLPRDSPAPSEERCATISPVPVEMSRRLSQSPADEAHIKEPSDMEIPCHHDSSHTPNPESSDFLCESRHTPEMHAEVPTLEVLREPTPVELREPSPSAPRELTPEIATETTHALREPIPVSTPIVHCELTEVVHDQTPGIPDESVSAALHEPSPVPVREPTPVFYREPTPELNMEPSAEILQETTPEVAAGPTPDIVPEERDVPHSHSEPVTDIDIGISESRAQEICVPITNEIRHEEVTQSVTTPTHTPALEPSRQDLSETPPQNETPIAAPAESADDQVESIVAAGAITATIVAAGAAAAAVTKSKTPAKKSPTTPTTKTSLPATKTGTAARTPSSATKAAMQPTTARTPSTRTLLTEAKPTTKSTLAPARATSATTQQKLSPKPTAKTTSTAAAKAAPASRAAPSARPAPKPAPAPATRAAAKPAPVAARAAPRPAPARAAAPRPAPAHTTAQRAAAPRPAPAPARPTRPAAPKPAERKSALPNGDAKPPATSARTTTTAARPASAPRTAPARPAPRTAAPQSAPPTRSSATTTKTSTRPPGMAGTKPSGAAGTKPSGAAGTKPALDKQSKDLTNKRITAKAAPPRTAPAKAPTKNVSSMATAKNAVKKPTSAAQNGLTNGDVAQSKPPPSPPPADNALPDVIA